MTREEQIKEAARQRANQYSHPVDWSDTYYGFIDGAKWADSHPQWYDAQGDKVPEYGREVIVIGRDGKIFYGHRPDPKEVTMVGGKPYHAKTYDKNGWNWPNIALWLDVEVPEELVDKITTEYFKEQSSQKESQNKKKWYSKSFNRIEAVCEFLNKHNLKSEDFKFSDCGVGTPYTILYFSDRYLC